MGTPVKIGNATENKKLVVNHNIKSQGRIEESTSCRLSAALVAVERSDLVASYEASIAGDVSMGLVLSRPRGGISNRNRSLLSVVRGAQRQFFMT